MMETLFQEIREKILSNYLDTNLIDSTVIRNLLLIDTMFDNNILYHAYNVMFFQNEVFKINYSTLNSNKFDILKYDYSLPKIIIEIDNFVDESILVIMNSETNDDVISHYLYIVDKSFPKNIINFISITINSNKMRVEAFIDREIKQVNIEDLAESEIIYGIFDFLHKQQNGKVSVEQFKKYEPPKDSILDSILLLAFSDQVPCYTAKIPINKIKPHSIEHFYRLTDEQCREISDLIRSGKHENVVVYQKENNFIMSDDYALLKSYNENGITDIPCTILGSFIDPNIKIIAKGFSELIPIPKKFPVRDNYDSNNIYNILKNEPDKINSNNYKALIRLRYLLDSEKLEKLFQDFFLQYPFVLSHDYSDINSEVSLGKDYRIDLVLSNNILNNQLLLIELENPTHKIFTKKGRLRAEVTHALQQVEDWIRWIKENPISLPPNIKKGIIPEGLVIIGRSNNLTQKEKNTIISLNETRKVKLMTYDDYVMKLKNTIINNGRRSG